MMEATSHRKKSAKPRGPAVRSPGTTQQPDDDSPSKRQCMNDVNEGASLTTPKAKQRKDSSKAKIEAGFRSGRHLVESGNSAQPRARGSQGGRDRKEDRETRGLVEDSALTPTRPAPRPPFSRNALPYASLPVAPPKPPRTYGQSPSSSLYPSLSPTLGDRPVSEINRKVVVPVPAPRGRTKGEPVFQKDTGVFAFDGGKVYGSDVAFPMATQRLGKRKDAKENFPLNPCDSLLEEPTRKPVSSRLMEWQRKAEENKKGITSGTAVCRTVNGRQEDFHAERSRKALSSALDRPSPCPAPRSGVRSESSDRMVCDVMEVHEGRAEEPFSGVQTGSIERFCRKEKVSITVDSNNVKTPQKKRNAPMPPSTNASNNKGTKAKNCLYPDITDVSTHTYFVLEEPGSSMRKQPKTSTVVEALPPISVSCLSDIYDVSGRVGLDGLLDESTGGLVSECLAGLTGVSKEVGCDLKSDLRGSGYSLAVATGGEDVDEEDDDDGDENIYCEIDSPVSASGTRKMEAYENLSSCQDSKREILQAIRLKIDQHAVTKQRPVLCLDSEPIAGNQSPAKTEKPKVSAMTPTSPGNHRLIWPKKTATPTITISHQMRSRSKGSQDEADDIDDLPFIPDPSVKLQLQTLQDLVYQELNVIHQTSNALAQCCHDLSAFSGSAEALECHRIILMACKKREAYVMEMQRLREAHSSTDDVGPRGILTISNIRLPLKPEFMSKIGTSFDTSVHHFVVMIRHGCNVVFTQLLSTHGAMVRSSLDYPDTFEFKDIRQNALNIGVEVYGMSVERTPGVYSSKKKKKKALNPMKALTPSCTRRPLSPGSLVSVRTSNFINIASLRLDSSHLSKMNFSLERIPFSSPLLGSIHLELGCQMESQLEERGFLTMFENRCGFGTWYRRWCVLRGGRLFYWKYPGEENEKDPIGFVDLKQCISETVDLVSRSYCARPNTFEMVILKRPQTEQKDGSVAVEGHGESDSVVKLWFSSDTKEERLNWCSQLSAALVNLRSWHPDALKPDRHWIQDGDAHCST